MPGRPRLLIVEDDPTMGKMLSTVLAEEYDLELVGDERAAHAAVQRRAVALVIVDIHPSRTNGLNLIYALRMDTGTRHLPVLVLTASEHRRMLLQCLAAGASNFLLKPFGMEDLRAAVRAELALADATPRPRA